MCGALIAAAGAALPLTTVSSQAMPIDASAVAHADPSIRKAQVVVVGPRRRRRWVCWWRRGRRICGWR
jgi:hypothetical protein